MALNTPLQDVATLISESLNSGQPAARQSLGGGGVAFGWSKGLVTTIANYCTTASADGMTFPVTRVGASGTPVAKVTAGTAKPNAITTTSGSEALQKFGGYGTANLEDYLNAANLGSAIASVLGKHSLLAFEAHAVGVLDAGAAATPVTGTDWVAAIASAQAAIFGQGGSPDVLVISGADYPGFLADVLATSAFSTSPESPIGAVMGTPVHVSPKAAAGKAWVFDSAAVIAVQHSRSPLVIVDSVSEAKSNKISIVTDLVASTFVVDSTLVIEITAPAAAMAADTGRKHK